MELARKSRPKARTLLAETWQRLSKNKAAMAGLIFVIIITLLALFADIVADYGTKVIQTHPLERLQRPSLQHPFGTDDMGRDLFARVVHGARYSLAFGIVCTLAAMAIGGALGAAAAFFGGAVEAVIMFIADTISCIPGTLLSLSLMAVLGPGLKNLMIAITFGGIPIFTRIIRSIVLGIVRQEYIEAARAAGVSNLRTIFLHVLPNAIGLIIVNFTMNVAGRIMAASALSYIGMGIQPPAPEWGAMLTDALKFLRTDPHVVIFPGMAIVITALSFNLLGDGLSEALDPRLRD
mgnify:CR=1 FL=1